MKKFVAGCFSALLLLGGPGACIHIPGPGAGKPELPYPYSRTCRVRGKRIHYLDTHPGGHERTLLVVHGFLGSTYPYLELAGLLRERMRVVIPDLPGFGYSEPPGEAVDLDSLTATLAEFAAALGLERFSILGSSLGATIGVRYAAAAPLTVEKLILCSPYGLESQQDAVKIATRWDRCLPLLAAVITRARIRRILRKRVVVDAAVITPELVDSYARPFSSRAGRRVIVQVMRTVVAEGGLDEPLSRLRQPVLVLLGGRDYLSGPDQVAEYRSRIADGEIVVLESYGHLFFYEDPETAAALISRFLDMTSCGQEDASPAATLPAVRP